MKIGFYFTDRVEMENEVNNEDQHIDHHRLIDYYPVKLEQFLRLIYGKESLVIVKKFYFIYK